MHYVGTGHRKGNKIMWKTLRLTPHRIANSNYTEKHFFFNWLKSGSLIIPWSCEGTDFHTVLVVVWFAITPVRKFCSNLPFLDDPEILHLGSIWSPVWKWMKQCIYKVCIVPSLVLAKDGIELAVNRELDITLIHTVEHCAARKKKLKKTTLHKNCAIVCVKTGKNNSVIVYFLYL